MLFAVNPVIQECPSLLFNWNSRTAEGNNLKFHTHLFGVALAKNFEYSFLTINVLMFYTCL